MCPFFRFDYMHFRSLARKLKAEAAKNNFALSHEKGNHGKLPLGDEFSHQKPTTLLDMDFSDGDDEVECGDMSNTEKAVEPTDADVISTSVNNVACHQRDEDYHPTADDITLMQRDLYYDLEDTEAKSVSSSALEEGGVEVDSPTTSLCTVEPFDTPHRDYYLRSRKDDDTSMQDCFGGLTPNILNMLDEDDPNMNAEMNASKFAESMSAPNVGGENDPEDQIYTSFLKSLFELSPQKTIASLPGAELVCPLSRFCPLAFFGKKHQALSFLATTRLHVESRCSAVPFGDVERTDEPGLLRRE